MRYIKNEVIDLAKSATEPTSTFADLMKFALNQPPHGGFDLSTIRGRLRVVAACDAATDVIALEDADFAVLMAAVRDCKWPWNHRAVVDLSNALGLLQ